MRALLHLIQHRLARHGRAAGAWRDVVELLSATALCALLEGWWRLRYSEAMTVSAARLTLALLPLAPLAMAAAAAGYLKAHLARLRGRRAEFALYRVLGGDMRRAACRQALSAALRLSIATAGGIGTALLLLPSSATPDTLPPPALTMLGALAAGLAIAAHAAWRTWTVPAAYDLAAGVTADDDADEAGDDPANDHAGRAIEQGLRALYAASPLLARRQAHPASRYRRALSPLLLAVYALLLDQHHQPRPHADDDLAQSGDDDNNADARHHAAGLSDTAGDGAVMWHHARLGDAASPSRQWTAGTEAVHASHPRPAVENGSAPSWMAAAERIAPPLVADAHGAAASLQTMPAHAATSHAAMPVALAGADTPVYTYDTATEAAPHPPLIRSSPGSPALILSELKAIIVAPLSNLQQESISQIGPSNLLAVSAVPLSTAELQQTPLSNVGATGLAINAVSSLSAQLIAVLSQTTIVSQTALTETMLASTRPTDSAAAHAGAISEPPASSAIVIVGQPLDGHASGLHPG